MALLVTSTTEASYERKKITTKKIAYPGTPDEDLVVGAWRHVAVRLRPRRRQVQVCPHGVEHRDEVRGQRDGFLEGEALGDLFGKVGQRTRFIETCGYLGIYSSILTFPKVHAGPVTNSWCGISLGSWRPKPNTLSPGFRLSTAAPASTTTLAQEEPPMNGGSTRSPPSARWRSRGVEAVHRTLTSTSSACGVTVGCW